MTLRLLFRLTLLAAALCPFTVVHAAAPANESESIKAARLAQNAAIAKGDLAKVVSFWTDDVTICRGLGIQLAGKAAYQTLFEADSSSPNRIVYERLPTGIEVSPHWPLAFETGVWNGHLGDLNGPTIISGRYSAQWVKRGETWLIRAEV